MAGHHGPGDGLGALRVGPCAGVGSRGGRGGGGIPLSALSTLSVLCGGVAGGLLGGCSVLLRLLSPETDDAPAGDGDPTGMRVSIGSENHDDVLAEASVVTAGYGVGQGQVLARLGVIGPTRMDYPATMTVVRAVARYLSRFMAGPAG